RHLAARGRGLRRLRGDPPGAARAVRGLGARRLDRRESAQVAGRPDGLLRAVDSSPGGLPERLQPRAGVPPLAGRRAEPQRGLDPARPPLPRAQALDGPALLRTVWPPGQAARAPAARRALRGLGARRARLGGDPAAALLAPLLPP